MKISDYNQRAQMEAYVNKAQAAQETQQQQQQQQSVQQNGAPSETSDRVQLSTGSRMLQRVNGTNEVTNSQRTEEIRAIKEEVQQGTYQIDAEKVARGMMRDLLKDLG